MAGDRSLRHLLRGGLRRAALYSVVPVYSRLRYGELGKYFTLSQRIPGWTEAEESIALAYACLALPPNAVVVEIGAFLGRSTVLFAGARKCAGSGHVHSIDPFDGSGEAYSLADYRRILARSSRSQFDRYRHNLRRAGLSDWVTPHKGTAEEVGPAWSLPIDMIFLDGDQSPEGARRAFDLFVPHLKRGGIVALHNSSEREYSATHDGHYQLRLTALPQPHFTDLHVIDTTTMARKLS